MARRPWHYELLNILILVLIFAVPIGFLHADMNSYILGSRTPSGGGATDYTADPNCVAAWYMNGTSVETDRSDNSEDLTASGTAPSQNSDVPSGYSGYSRLFVEASTTYLTHADGGSTDISGANQAISYCCWIKFVTVDSGCGFIAKYTPTSDKQYCMFFAQLADQIKIILSDDGSTQTECLSSVGSADFSSGWHHFAVVYNDTDIRFYFDGVLDSNGANNPKAYTSGLYDGGGAFYLGRTDTVYLDGYMDEAIILNRALSAVEVVEIYTHGIDGTKGGND